MSRYTHARMAVAAFAAATALLATGIPVVAAAAAPVPAGASPQGTASRAQLLSAAAQQSTALARAIGLGDQEKLVAKDVVVDANGTRHLRFDRTYAGLPVLGGDLIVHQDRTGATESVDRANTASLNGLGTTPAITAPKAQSKALATESGSTLNAAPQLVVWANGTPKLAWKTLIGGRQSDGTPSRLQVVTDARTGAVLSSTETIETGTGNGVFVGQVPLTTTLSGSTYQLKDATRGGQYSTDMNNGTSGNGTLFTNSTDTWGNGQASNRQSAAVDAQYGAAATWDFYKNTFGRNGIRNDGVGAYSRVHYDSGYENAFWDDTCFCMTYGDGAGNTHPLTEIDVSGHEMSHGVTAATANLNYSGESGGLNEGTSDILGTGVEWYANLASNPPNYDIGELINLNGDGTPLRYMDKPSKDGSSADSWYSGVGNLDVHYSSGVANHLFYLLAEGSGAKTINGFSYNSPTVNNITVAGIGRDKALHVWYQALTAHMTSTTNYASARTATLAAATDLYGTNSTEYNQVATAWAAVNVGSLPTGGVTVTNPGNQSTATGSAVSLQVHATGGTGTLTYSATGLPAGLSISSSGLISGTPTTAGTSSVTVTAKDSTNATGSASFSWTVSTTTGNAVNVTNPGSQTGTVGTPASLQISASDSASGQTLTYSATGLPAGLSINAATGLISGTPTTAGTSSVTVTAKDSTNATGSASFSWTVTGTAGGCPSPGQKLGNPGFETGTASPWTATAGVVDNSSGEAAHAGSWKAWLDGYGSTHTDTLSQTVTIPTGCSAALTFYLHIDSAETTTSTAYDTLKVQVGTTTLATYSNLNKATGYSQKSLNLSGYAGQTVTLKFTGAEDSSLQTSFVVDDTALNVS